MNRKLLNKLKEALTSVLPITAIVLILSFTIAPLSNWVLTLFLIGAVMLILGMALFTLGADLAMMPMGERIGAEMTKSRNISLLIFICFLMGVAITIAEPDLAVLARQVPAVPDSVLIICVAVGVGLFLVMALLRIIFQKKLSSILIFLYILVFIIAAFTSEDYLSVAFDSGGVTTGPITVPFIMALGIGVCAVRSGNSSLEDSFGLVALCSVGPILAVLIMGIFFDSSSGAYAAVSPSDVNSMQEVLLLFGSSLPEYFKEVGIALSPIIVFFAIFQIFFLKLPKKRIIKMVAGIVYTYVGLVLFLTGVNVGFMPAGNLIGAQIATLSYNGILIPIAMIIGLFVVVAEPAVHVLTTQVEEITSGTITKRSLLFSLSFGVALALGLSMIRVLTGLSIWYIIVPGYVLSLGLSFFVPKIFTAIAFDSGGVASGPMTATFVLPFAMGACEAVGGNILTDAFGIVAMVAMTPLITIQILGVIYKIKTRHLPSAAVPADAEDDIIEL